MSAGIFRQDNPYNTVMSRVGDLAMLSIAWTLGSLPVFTIGASTAAACEVAREIVEDSDHGIFRAFWTAFTRRFATNCLFTLLFAAIGGLCAFNLWWISRQSGSLAAVYYGMTIAIFAIIAALLAFVLPLAGRSNLTFTQQITQSARLALMRPLVAFGIVALNALPVVLLFTVPTAILWVPIFWTIIGSGTSCWLQMTMICRTFALQPASTHQ